MKKRESHESKAAIQITRRNLIKDFAIGGAGLATLGLLGACSSAPDVQEASGQTESWDYEADIVVVGFGGAGSAAAAKAAELGDKVLILEKMSEAFSGGDTSCCGGAIFPGQEVDGYIYYSNYTMSEEAAEALNAATEKAYEWACSSGFELKEDGYSVVGGAQALYDAVREDALGKGAEVLYETPAVELIQDPVSKEIRGVYAQGKEGRIAVLARKAVLLCSGDYIASKELMGSMHYPHLEVISAGTPAATGDGMIMAYSVGAKYDHASNVCVEWGGVALKTASEELGTALIYDYGSVDNALAGSVDASGAESKIIVNFSGERFMSEYAQLGHNKTTSTLNMLDIQGALTDTYKGYLNLPMFLVFDSSCFNAMPLMKSGNGCWWDSKKIYEWSEDNKAELDKGWIIEGNTLEELAAKMVSYDYMSGEKVSVPVDALLATVEEYNAGCVAGSDAFGRMAVAPLQTPPFYAIELCPGGIYTLGTLVGDEKARVLDWNNEPIPRLYRCGNIGQGAEWTPIGVSGCMGHGFMAAEDAVTLAPWKAES